jgi:hypothetical protein
MRARLDLITDERILAVGRCADITEIGGIEQAGAASTYLMVTTTKLRWIPYSFLEFEASLDLDAVTAFSERTLAHRYALQVEHPPLARKRPPHEFPPELATQMRSEGRLRGDGVNPLSGTELAFSRRNTRADRALRKSLVTRLGSSAGS